MVYFFKVVNSNTHLARLETSYKHKTFVRFSIARQVLSLPRKFVVVRPAGGTPYSVVVEPRNPHLGDLSLCCYEVGLATVHTTLYYSLLILL